MARGHRKNMKAGGSDYGQGTEPPQTQGYSNNATNSQEDAANAGDADGDKLNELNNIQGGGKRRRRQRGGEGEIKAVDVDSPARETASGPYTAQSQVTANQESTNQGVADTEFDNPGPAQKGGKRRRKRSRRQTKRKSKKNGKKKTVKKSRRKRSRKHR